MKKLYKTVELGGETYRICWDMTAADTVERETGKSLSSGIQLDRVGTLLTFLWAAIDAAAASEDKECPVTKRRLGTLLSTPEDMERAFEAVGEVVAASMPEAAPAVAGASGKANRSRSGSSTKLAS